MTFKLTEEQRQEIQAGLDSLIIPGEKGERDKDWNCWAGIERQLQDPKTFIKDGREVKCIFHMARRLPITEEEKENPLFYMNFNINRMILEES